MTDRSLVIKKLTRIDQCVLELRGVDAAALGDDIIIERFVERTLQLAIQAIIDLASHIVADDQLGDPSTTHELLDLLARNGWIEQAQLPVLHRVIGFRNVLVHDYDDVDIAVVRLVVSHHLGDLVAFADAVRAKLAERQP